MNSNEILNRHFEKAFNGYKIEDVDEFLRVVSEEYSKLQKENDELEHKLGILADKIREYRSDEEALKDALLVAQKQANAIVAQAKENAQKLTDETNENIEKLTAEANAENERILREANYYSEKTKKEADEFSEKTRKEAEFKAYETISDAEKKAEEIRTECEKQKEIENTVIMQAQKEALEFRQRLLDCYNEQIKLIETLPEKCENEYVKRACEEEKKREEERAAAEKAEAERLAAEKAEAERIAAEKAEAERIAAEKAEAERIAAEKAEAERQAAEKAEKAFDEKKADDDNALDVSDGDDIESSISNAINKKNDRKAVERTDDKKSDDLPFFNSTETRSLRHADLRFGKNNDMK